MRSRHPRLARLLGLSRNGFRSLRSEVRVLPGALRSPCKRPRTVGRAVNDTSWVAWFAAAPAAIAAATCAANARGRHGRSCRVTRALRAHRVDVLVEAPLREAGIADERR